MPYSGLYQCNVSPKLGIIRTKIGNLTASILHREWELNTHLIPIQQVKNEAVKPICLGL